jgi:hypothetical protein
VALTVRAQRLLLGSAEPRMFEVRAGCPNQKPTTATAQFVRLPLVPPWVLLALVGAILVLALLANARLGIVVVLLAGGWLLRKRGRRS